MFVAVNSVLFLFMRKLILISILFLSILVLTVKVVQYKTQKLFQLIYSNGDICTIDTELEDGFCLNKTGMELLKNASID